MRVCKEQAHFLYVRVEPTAYRGDGKKKRQHSRLCTYSSLVRLDTAPTTPRKQLQQHPTFDTPLAELAAKERNERE